MRPLTALAALALVTFLLAPGTAEAQPSRPTGKPPAVEEKKSLLGSLKSIIKKDQ